MGPVPAECRTLLPGPTTASGRKFKRPPKNDKNVLIFIHLLFTFFWNCCVTLWDGCGSSQGWGGATATGPKDCLPAAVKELLAGPVDSTEPPDPHPGASKVARLLWVINCHVADFVGILPNVSKASPASGNSESGRRPRFEFAPGPTACRRPSPRPPDAPTRSAASSGGSPTTTTPCSPGPLPSPGPSPH